MDTATDVKPVQADGGASPANAVDNQAEATPANLLDGLHNAIREGFEASKKDEPQAEVVQEQAPESETTQEAEPEPEAQEAEAQVEETQTKGPIPYERFQEVVHARQKLEADLQETKPVIDAYNSITAYCDQNRISPEDYQYWLSVAAQAANNPAKALEMLRPRFAELQTVNGEVLPKDLSDAVASGEMTETMARRLAAAEARHGMASKQVQLTREQMVAQEQQRHYNNLQGELGRWIEQQKKTIPEFKPRNGEGPDGLFEQWIYKFRFDGERSQIRDARDLIALAEKTLTSVRPKANGKVANGKVVTSRQSTANLRPGQPKNLQEAMAQGAAAAGIRWSPPARAN